MNEIREAVARALYECEAARSAKCAKVMSAAAGKPIKDHMETWEEAAEIFRADADAVLAVVRAHACELVIEAKRLRAED